MHTGGYDDYLELFPTWIENIKNKVFYRSYNIMRR